MGTVGLLTGVVLASCGGASGPLEVPIANLREKPNVYVGDEISAEGRIAKARIAGEPSYVLQNDGGEAVLVEPRNLASRAAGREVRVEGVFVIDLGGRPLLKIEALDRIGAE